MLLEKKKKKQRLVATAITSWPLQPSLLAHFELRLALKVLDLGHAMLKMHESVANSPNPSSFAHQCPLISKVGFDPIFIISKKWPRDAKVTNRYAKNPALQ